MAKPITIYPIYAWCGSLYLFDFFVILCRFASCKLSPMNFQRVVSMHQVYIILQSSFFYLNLISYYVTCYKCRPIHMYTLVMVLIGFIIEFSIKNALRFFSFYVGIKYPPIQTYDAKIHWFVCLISRKVPYVQYLAVLNIENPFNVAAFLTDFLFCSKRICSMEYKQPSNCLMHL